MTRTREHASISEAGTLGFAWSPNAMYAFVFLGLWGGSIAFGQPFEIPALAEGLDDRGVVEASLIGRRHR